MLKANFRRREARDRPSQAVAGCRAILPGQAIGEPGVAAGQVRGHHLIVVIRRTGTTQDGWDRGDTRL